MALAIHVSFSQNISAEIERGGEITNISFKNNLYVSVSKIRAEIDGGEEMRREEKHRRCREGKDREVENEGNQENGGGMSVRRGGRG